jgi:hypothetical protein
MVVEVQRRVTYSTIINELRRFNRNLDPIVSLDNSRLSSLEMATATATVVTKDMATANLVDNKLQINRLR